MSQSPRPGKVAPPRVRMARDARLQQLLSTAWKIVRQEGTDALTLGTLAERAGVTKPVVYDHFGTRNGLLARLYGEFDARQADAMDKAIAASRATLVGKAAAVASSYVDCVLLQGREMPGVLAALAGSPEMAALKGDYQRAFLDKCQKVLAPFAAGEPISPAGLWAMLGAADALSEAAARGAITAEEAKAELQRVIIYLVRRR